MFFHYLIFFPFFRSLLRLIETSIELPCLKCGRKSHTLKQCSEFFCYFCKERGHKPQRSKCKKTQTEALQATASIPMAVAASRRHPSHRCRMRPRRVRGQWYVGSESGKQLKIINGSSLEIIFLDNKD